VSRRQLFERLERATLRPLPGAPYEYADWHKKTLNVDYHVEVEKHWYSAPFRLVHRELWVRVTAQVVEVFHLGDRIASHRRSFVPYKHTSDPAHMPEAHRRHAAGPDGVLRWAESVGPMATALVQRLLDINPVREQGWRSARGCSVLAKSTARSGPSRHAAPRCGLALGRTSRSNGCSRSAARPLA
jgi:hypothetical protein